MQMSEPQKKTVGIFTFAHVEFWDDSWGWAIVTHYKGSQEYGDVVCGFVENVLPNPVVLEIMLESLNFEHDTGNYTEEHLT